MNLFIQGAIMFGFFVASIFFAKFWRETHDRLFLLFALSFGLMGVNRIGFLLTGLETELRTYQYFVRLIAFILIIVAIVDKNVFAKTQVRSDKVAP
jgi:hypothetical protein